MRSDHLRFDNIHLYTNACAKLCEGYRLTEEDVNILHNGRLLDLIFYDGFISPSKLLNLPKLKRLSDQYQCPVTKIAVDWLSFNLHLYTQLNVARKADHIAYLHPSNENLRNANDSLDQTADLYFESQHGKPYIRSLGDNH